MKEKEVGRQFLARLKELHKETGLELTILGMQTPEIGPYLMGKADALEVASQVTRAYATVSGIRAFLIHEEARMLDMAASKRENPYHADAQLARICDGKAAGYMAAMCLLSACREEVKSND